MARLRRLDSFGPLWEKLANTIVRHPFDEPIKLEFSSEKDRDNHYFLFYNFRKSLENHVKVKSNEATVQQIEWLKALNRCRLSRMSGDTSLVINTIAMDEMQKPSTLSLLDQLDNIDYELRGSDVAKEKLSYKLDHDGKEYMVDFDPADPDNVPLVMEFIVGLEGV